MSKYHKVILIGMMATGKSTIGKILSNNINFKYLDTDVEIGASKYINDNTINQFRNRENEQILRIQNLDNNYIISTGGGVVDKQENILLLRKYFCIHLKASLNTIVSRIKKDNKDRPMVKLDSKNEIDLNELNKLYNTRIKAYESLSSFTIQTDIYSKNQIVEIIKENLFENEFIN
tara:strand:+ start:27927 stop:28454 length:528 start_codon:yes stop_codon:yes gene_type:complete